jgi:hypothetical protein
VFREEYDLTDVIREVHDGALQCLDDGVTFTTDEDVSEQIAGS